MKFFIILTFVLQSFAQINLNGTNETFPSMEQVFSFISSSTPSSFDFSICLINNSYDPYINSTNIELYGKNMTFL